MNPSPSQPSSPPLRGRFRLAAAALVPVLACGALTLLGARPFVCVLSGTAGNGGEVLLGLAYAASYFAAVVLALPLLVAGLYRAWPRARRSSRLS